MSYQPKRAPLDPCPVEEVVGLISGKWKARILLLVFSGYQTFSELARMLGEAPDQVLASQLKGLIADGLLYKSPPTFQNGSGSRYSLTEQGRSLMGLLQVISEWGLARLDQRGAFWTPPEQRGDESSRSESSAAA